MDDKSQKSKLIDKIKDANNILITVSRNPNIDQLTSALALALAINRLDKRAVAVFSGSMPKSLNFLNPQKTFESNADSLRDFIILIDKEKAGRLRVNADGDFAKVYITPYRTKITTDDIKFEDGDFNVELIIAIGVTSREELDLAIASHGKIFHDAITATINMDKVHDELGSISWQDEGMDCYSEMIAMLVNSLSEGQNHVLMDEAVSTALLTGVVSATDQFRNNSTTPSIMSLAADLMAHGANQQLISSELAKDLDKPAKKSDDKIEYSRPAKEPKSYNGKSANTGNKSAKSSNDLEITHNKPSDHSVFTGVTVAEKPSSDNLAETLMDVEQKHGAEVNRMNKMVVEENSRLAQKRSEDAVAIAHSQLTEDEINRQNMRNDAVNFASGLGNERLAVQPEPVATLSPTVPAAPSSIPTSIKPIMTPQTQMATSALPDIPPMPTMAPMPAAPQSQPQSQPLPVQNNANTATTTKPTPAYMIANRVSPIPPLAQPLQPQPNVAPEPLPRQSQVAPTPSAFDVPLPPPPPLPDFNGLNLGGESQMQSQTMSKSSSVNFSRPTLSSAPQPTMSAPTGSADLAMQAANLAQPAAPLTAPAVPQPATQPTTVSADPAQFVIPS